jgi:hypothetical protein
MKLLSAKEFGIMVAMRFQQFVGKCIAVKMIPFTVATVALFFGKIDSWIWLLTGVLFVAFRTFEKFFLKETPSTIQAGGK